MCRYAALDRIPIFFKKLIPRLLPFFAVHIVMLMLITYVPAITTWLPTFIASLK